MVALKWNLTHTLVLFDISQYMKTKNFVFLESNSLQSQVVSLKIFDLLSNATGIEVQNGFYNHVILLELTDFASSHCVVVADCYTIKSRYDTTPTRGVSIFSHV